MTEVCVVVPEGVDDPARPSGGNRYDRRICDGLAAAGWAVREVAVPGAWPRPDAAALGALARAVAAVPDGGLVLVDGLVASPAPAVLVPESGRVRLVVQVHTPLGSGATSPAAERAVLTHARAVLTPSAWTRGWLLDRYPLPADRVHVAPPGADRADPADGSPAGDRLLCVAAVWPSKGHDVLVEALASLDRQTWRCTFVGSLERDPQFVARLRRQVAAAGLADRIAFAGPRGGDDLHRQYATADLLVLPSHFETYGMVVTEALAAGLPVVATAVGGVPEALGRTRAGLPGLLVPPGDPRALGEALARWLSSATLRQRLRRAARARRGTLRGWDTTTAQVAAVLTGVAGEPDLRPIRVPG